MSTHENKALVRRLFAIFNKQDSTTLGDVLAPNFVTHEPNDLIQGVAGVTLLRQALPDVYYTIEGDILAEADKVVTRWQATGIHRGELFGAAPSGKQITWTGITIWRVAGGKIVEAWVNRDTLGILQQLHAIPTFDSTQR